jgi:serine/threonine-protein kinase
LEKHSRIVTVIGRDPGGVTYLAEATSGLPRRVALKMVGPRADAQDILARYQRWRGALEGLHHPAVRRLLDAGLAGPDQVYLASEYVVGTTLAERLARDPLPDADRIEIARQVSGALTAAHAAGIVHGALDSSHIRIAWSPGPAVKVFGIGTSLIVDGLIIPTEEDDQAFNILLGDMQIDPTRNLPR